MVKTTVYLPESVAHGLRRLAEADGRTAAALIREALERYLEQSRVRADPPLPAGVGGYRSGRSDISERLEDYLSEAVAERKR